MKNLLLGYHIDTERTLYDTYSKINDNGIKANQIFLGKRSIIPADILKTREIKHEFNFIHGFLTSNLAGTVTGESDPEYDRKLNYAKAILMKEVDVAASLSASVVVHPGYRSNRPQGLLTVAETVSYALSNVGNTGRMFGGTRKILLENCAGEKNHLGENLQELLEIINYSDAGIRDQIGICVDTCHTYGAGLYNFGNIKHVEQFFQDFNNILGEKLKLFHLNDSKEAWNSKKDRHESIGFGYIFNENNLGLKQLLSICRDKNIPLVLETHSPVQDYNMIMHTMTF